MKTLKLVKKDNKEIFIELTEENENKLNNNESIMIEFNNINKVYFFPKEKLYSYFNIHKNEWEREHIIKYEVL